MICALTIRSARVPYIERLVEYDAVYVHFGGSEDGLQLLYDDNIDNVNGMDTVAGVFWREDVRYAPHNAYTNVDNIRKEMERLDYPLIKPEPPAEIETPQPIETGESELSAESVVIDYSGGQSGTAANLEAPPISYTFFEKPTSIGGEPATTFYLTYNAYNEITYRYNAEEMTYERLKNGQLHVDENDQEPILVTNIIVQFADSFVYDQMGHVQFEHVGEGQGFLFSCGEVKEIKWSKENRYAPTILTDKDGKPITLNPGLTFFQVMDEDAGVTIEPVEVEKTEPTN